MDKLNATIVRLGMEKPISSQSEKIQVFWFSPFSVEVVHDTGQVIYCWVTHSFFSDPVLISYVYANCFIPVQ